MIRISEAEGKDPDDVDDFSVNWVNDLRGATIASGAATSSDVTVVQSQVSDALTVARLAAGTEGDDARVRYTIETSDGRVLHQTLILPIRGQ